MWQTCQMCGTEDDVTFEPLGPDLFEYTCHRSKKHPNGEAYSWEGSKSAVAPIDAEGETGPAHELGMLDDLVGCVVSGEPWIEYGIVERRYREAHGWEFDQLVARFGYREPGVHRPYTASAYIGSVLAMLRRRERLVSLPGGGKGTGYWKYNQPSSYWAIPPGPATSHQLSFVDWAQAAGHDSSKP